MNYYDHIVCNSKFDFSSDTVDIFILLYDVSGSMDAHVSEIRRANETFKKVFSRFEEKGSVAISKAVFSEGCRISPFKSVDEFDTSYSTYGSTHLYSAICEVVDATIEYYRELIKRINIQARITLLVFSDGEDNERAYNMSKAADKIRELNSLDATTVFVAFDAAIDAKDGENLGFSCTRDIHSSEELVSCLGVELSRSCIEQSKSAFALKSQFFSQANPTDNTANPSEAGSADAELDAVLGNWFVTP